MKVFMNISLLSLTVPVLAATVPAENISDQCVAVHNYTVHPTKVTYFQSHDVNAPNYIAPSPRTFEFRSTLNGTGKSIIVKPGATVNAPVVTHMFGNNHGVVVTSPGPIQYLPNIYISSYGTSPMPTFIYMVDSYDIFPFSQGGKQENFIAIDASKFNINTCQPTGNIMAQYKIFKK